MGRCTVLALLLLLGLAGCAHSDQGGPADAAGAADIQGWRFASGKLPTGVEYAAVVAACRDDAVTSARGKPLDTCLADLGLRRVE